MIARRPTRPKKEPIPPLVDGERLRQPEFHRRYEAMPEHVKAELIGGIVYMASPQRKPHSTEHPTLSMLLRYFETHTPGVETLDNATTILDEDSEPQPDLALRILEECGGQTRENEDHYVVGAPELIAEVAHSSRAIDLGPKKLDYERSGVIEYIVISITEAKLYWFRLKQGDELRPDARGVYHSEVFPGLWIDGPALLARDGKQLLRILDKGLASPEHAAFVQRLEAARKKKRR